MKRVCKHVLVISSLLIVVAVLTRYEILSPAYADGVENKGIAKDKKVKDKVLFDIWEFDIEGNSLLDTKSIERTVYRFLGPDRSLKDIEEARKSLESFYHGSGYPTVVVNLPEQDVVEGVVRLVVIEGKVSRVRVTGSRYFSLDRLRSEIPSLEPGQVPNLPDLQDQIRKVNAVTPDRRVTPVFRPGRTPGTVEVDLKIKDELPLHAEVELTGRNSRDTTRSRLSTTLRYSNLFQKGHSASLMLMTSPENTNDVKVASLTYVMPMERSSDIFVGYGVVTKSDVATAGAITVLGDGTIVGARYIHPLMVQNNYFHSATLGVDYKDFGESIRPFGADRVDTPLDYVSFSASYRGTLLKKTGRSTFGVGVKFGVRGLGNSTQEFENKRFKAVPNFIYTTAFIEHDYKLPGSFTLHGALNGQIADTPLVSNEQFSAGGAESVRGYFESQALGDDGVRGSIELRSPSLASYFSSYMRKLTLYSFFDGAKLRLQDPLPGQAVSTALYGAGAGLRMEGPGAFKADFALAWPLKDDGTVERGDIRSHFRVFYGF